MGLAQELLVDLARWVVLLGLLVQWKFLGTWLEICFVILSAPQIVLCDGWVSG